MKFKNKLTTVLLATSLLGLSSGVYAGQTPVQEVQFKVTKYNLIGFTGPSYVKADVRNQLVSLLNQYTGSNITPSKLNELKSKLQAVLNQDAKGVFTVNIPRQTIKNGVVVLNVNFVAGKVLYGETDGFSRQNVERSIPSLKQGIQFVAGRPWIDERELTMAVENPLKLTQVEYELQPGQPIVAHVNVIAPRGKTIRYVSVNNSGSKEYNYVQTTAGYINANLTGKDDVLALVAITNLQDFSKYFAFGGSYSRPFYAQHQRLDFSLFHAQTQVKQYSPENQPDLKIDAKGSGDIATVNWSYYLPHYDWAYSNQLKVVAGYTFKRLKTETAANGRSTTVIPFYFVSPFNVGVTGKVIPFRGLDLEFSAKYNFLYSGFLGTSSLADLRQGGGRLVTAQKFEDWWTGSFSVRKTLPQNWTWFTSLGAQYSNKFLVSSERYSNNVRGFRQGSGSGDSGAWIKNELISANLSNKPNFDIKGYGFVDAGLAHYNRNAQDIESNIGLTYGVSTDGGLAPQVKTRTVASAGLGLRVAYKDFSTDVYAAYQLKGQAPNAKAYKDRTSLWFSANYKW